ncbi:MAG: hypothetical protein EOM53_04500 [Alphaproteobacteria bacterium]|nr:hypothetical protein [Alphaproteobacteria bacterium]NCB49917.1 hypothetical protein [Alphaproteobacteria bacterium]
MLQEISKMSDKKVPMEYFYPLSKVEVELAFKEESHRVESEYKNDVRCLFLKGLALFYKDQIETFFSPEVYSQILEGHCPNGFNIHHQIPRNLGGQNYSQEAFDYYYEEMPSFFKRSLECERSSTRRALNFMLLPRNIKKTYRGASTEDVYEIGKERFNNLFSRYLILMNVKNHNKIHRYCIDPQIESALVHKVRSFEHFSIKVPLTEKLFALSRNSEKNLLNFHSMSLDGIDR